MFEAARAWIRRWRIKLKPFGPTSPDILRLSLGDRSRRQPHLAGAFATGSAPPVDPVEQCPQAPAALWV
jgi:hypothetical protein